MYPTTSREQALALLEEHITENVVKIGNEFYQQVIGIPQGSVISSLLCSFFYGNLEKTHFGDIMSDSSSVSLNSPKLVKITDLSQMLVRLIDDYLLVTTDLEKAKSFWQVMNAGHTEYGCFISPDKTLVNFDCDTRTRRISPKQHVFPWCGYYIDMGTLAVSSDYTRFHDKCEPLPCRCIA
jgi:telomerase reverse transcriptase